MQNRQHYQLSLSEEKEALIKENAELRSYIRKETLEVSEPLFPETILKKTSRRYYIKILFTTLLVLGILTVLVLFGLSFFQGVTRTTIEDNSLSDPDFIPDTTENLNVVGSGSGLSNICAQNGIYYYFKERTLYRWRHGQETPLTEADGEWLNAYAYCLYYYNKADKSIVRFRTDGKSTQILLQNESIRKMEVYNSTVFYITEIGELKSIYINGTKNYSLISDEKILDFVVWNGMIYYTVQKEETVYLRRCNTGGGNRITVTQADSPQLCVAEGKICYIHDRVLYAFDPKEEQSCSVFADVSSFAFLNSRFLLTLENGSFLCTKNGSRIFGSETDFDTVDKIIASIEEEGRKLD